MIWLIGYKGMLGTEVVALLKKQEKPYMVSDQEIDITNIDQLNEFTENKSISWIINCAAYTAVDKAEDEQRLAFKIAWQKRPLKRCALRDGTHRISLLKLY